MMRPADVVRCHSSAGLSTEGVPVLFIPRVATGQHTLAGFTFAPSIVPWLWREIPQCDFVHVHTVFSFPAAMAMAIARRKCKPYCARPLGQLCTWSLRTRTQLKRFHLATIGRGYLDSAAFLHVTSRKEADETAALGLRSPVKLLPLGVDILPSFPADQAALRARLGIPAGNTIALFLSRLHPGKRLDVLLRAMSIRSDLKMSLIVCGDGEKRYVDELHQLANKLGIGARVHWLGFIEGERKWRTMCGCDFFVLPSISENFGIAAIEALAAGLFVVVSPEVGVATEILSPGIAEVTAGDQTSLGETLRNVAENERFDTSARATRRAFVEARFSWDGVIQELIGAYEGAICRGN